MSRFDRGARRGATRLEVMPLEGRRLLTSGLTSRSSLAALGLAAAARRQATVGRIAPPPAQMAATPTTAAGNAAIAGSTRVAVQSARGTLGTTPATSRLAPPVVIQSNPTVANRDATSLARPTVRLATAASSPLVVAQDAVKRSPPRVVMLAAPVQATPTAAAVATSTAARPIIRST